MMNRKYGIGFLIGIIVIIFVFVFGFQFSYSRALDRQSQDDEVQTEILPGYWIKEEDGYVIVYMGDNQRIYEYTSIWVEDLPETVQNELAEGIYMTEQSEVYGFLENYSS